MMHLWCWLFGSCVAAVPAPAPAPAPVAALPPPPAISAEAPPAVAAQVPPAPPDSVRLGLALALPAAPRTPPGGDVAVTPPPPVAAPPAWQRFAVPPPPAEGRPTLSLVLDDMGGNPALSARAVALHGPLTLAWLPSAPQLAAQLAVAATHGHEAMLHMPMEALGRADPGADALRTWLPPASNRALLRAALDRVPTAVALTAPEGSVATLSVPLMDLLTGELAARRIAFLDSPALPHGVALARAEAAGLATVGRGLSIDADPAPAAIRARLADAEAIAQRSGHAVVIGHPRPTTLDVLEAYLPTLAARGIVLWPLSATIAAEIPANASGEAAPREPAHQPAPEPAIPATASEVMVAPAQSSGAE